MSALTIVLVNVVLLVGGQLLWKQALIQHPLRTVHDIPSLALQPLLLAGLLLYVIATLIWFYALSRFDLSRIYPLQSLAYVVGAVGGIALFKETVHWQQWFGMGLVVCGAWVMSR